MIKNYISPIIIGSSVILSCVALGKAYVDRSTPKGTINVKGLGSQNILSDYIVWEGNFVSENKDLKLAYSKLESDKKKIISYLNKKGIKKEEYVFEAVNTIKKNERRYSVKGDFIGEVFLGYSLSQPIRIESDRVDAIENISREITDLLEDGVNFFSNSPRYYYTRLADLKIEMISKATEDARERAEKIALYSKGNLGELLSANMGVFQIIGKNSTETYSWGGTFNTSSKEKTVSITINLSYKVK